MSVCRRIFSCFLVVCLLLLVGAGIVLYNITRAPKGPDAAPARHQAEPPTEADRRSAQEMVERWRAQASAPPPRSRRSQRGSTPARPRRMRVTEKEVNQLLHAHPEVRKTLDQYHLSAPQVHFEPGRVLASARVPVWGKMEARVSATGRIQSGPEGLEYETEEVRVGDFPAPKPIRDALDTQIKGAIERLNDRVGDRVGSVEVREGELVIEGK